jgi:hypothetical protein
MRRQQESRRSVGRPLLPRRAVAGRWDLGKRMIVDSMD